jgi:LPS export ABC transporter permease LptF/LPS export ABC transporter permease LptG
MRILTRYILREVLGSALIGIAVFSFVLFTRDLGRILELVVRNSAPLPSVAEIFFFTLPVALTYTIPMGVLVGILIGLGRLAADSEITAMRASGIGVWRFVRMLSLFVAVAWALAMLNSLWIAPASQAAMARLQDRLKTAQASFEVQPRVFYEGFPKAVLYVQDVVSAQRAAVWKGVFLADLSNPVSPRITLARQGLLVSEGPSSLHLHLTGGSTHEVNPATTEDYQISTFEDTDIPIDLPTAESDAPKGQAPLGTMPTGMLWQRSKAAGGASGGLDARWAGFELHRRLALPTACLVLALVGIPLGLSAKKGGKSSGFVITIILVFAYYSFSLIGVSLAKEGKLPVVLGAWLADLVFLAGGVVLLYRVEKRPIDLGVLRRFWVQVKERLRAPTPKLSRRESASSAYSRAERRPRVFGLNFPMLLDDYVLKDFFQYLGLIVASFVVLLLVFTLFELLGDILRNHVSPLVVGAYLLNVTPYFLYNTLHLCVLLTVVVTFGILQRNNEIVAMKATGISIYRIVVPVMVMAALLTAGLFVFDQIYLPHANKRQDALRNEIKGKPAQTYLRPDRKWIFGQNSDIYYYQFFDSDRDRFANISVFQFDPVTFEVTRRVYAARAHWDQDLNRWIFEQGWERSLRGPAIENFQEFEVSTFPQFSEPPAYFKKEVIQSSEMSYGELQHYIHDLQQSGFDVVRLRVQLHKKLAFPLITLVMALLAVPFSLNAGRRSTLAGAASAVGIAVVYLVVSGLFEALGNLSQLPAPLAAWSPDIIFALVGGYLMLKVPT